MVFGPDRKQFAIEAVAQERCRGIRLACAEINLRAEDQGFNLLRFALRRKVRATGGEKQHRNNARGAKVPLRTNYLHG
jgi:hypothetical protein